jgi:hypothetical protein
MGRRVYNRLIAARDAFDSGDGIHGLTEASLRVGECMEQRRTIASLAVGLGVMLVCFGAASDETSAGFRVENVHIDVGRVTAGTDVYGTFVFHNDTDADVNIIRAKPS